MFFPPINRETKKKKKKEIKQSFQFIIANVITVSLEREKIFLKKRSGVWGVGRGRYKFTTYFEGLKKIYLK